MQALAAFGVGSRVECRCIPRQDSNARVLLGQLFSEYKSQQIPASQVNLTLNTSTGDVSDDEISAELADLVHTPPGDYLPPHPQSCYPCFKWSSIDGPTFVKSIIDVYDEVVHWRRNIFNLPFRKGRLIIFSRTFPSLQSLCYKVPHWNQLLSMQQWPCLASFFQNLTEPRK